MARLKTFRRVCSDVEAVGAPQRVGVGDLGNRSAHNDALPVGVRKGDARLHFIAVGVCIGREAEATCRIILLL